MSRTDQRKLQEAYSKLYEAENTSFYEDALKNPKDYKVYVELIPHLDNDSDVVPMATIFKATGNSNVSDTINNPSDIEALVDLFNEQNPLGLVDYRL